MSAALSRNAERVRQLRTDRAAKSLAGAENIERSGADVNGTFVVGARVFDSVSGLEGDVLGVSGLAATPSREIEISLEGGLLARRRPDVLILRPTRPEARA